MALSTLCLRLAAAAEAKERGDIAFILRMAARLAVTSNIDAPNVTDQYLGTWVWDVPNDRVFIEPLAARLFGVDPIGAKAGLPLAIFAQAMHGDDVGRVMASISRSSRRGGSYSEIYRTAVDGKIRTILAQGYVSLDDHNEPLRFSGALFDLSDSRADVSN